MNEDLSDEAAAIYADKWFNSAMPHSACIDGFLEARRRAEANQAKREESLLATIDERDAAAEAMSQAYYLVIGRSAEWSNLFGYEQANEDIGDAVESLKAHIRDRDAQIADLRANPDYRANEIKWMNIVTKERSESAKLRGLLEEWSQHGDVYEQWACMCAQLLDGWHADGTCWSEHDESIRKDLTLLQTQLLSIRQRTREALGGDKS
jgi:hypothetical protein